MPPVPTLSQALAAAAAGSEGYIFADRGGERRRSYVDLRASALGVASFLRRAGLERGDVVALIIPDAELFLAGLFGTSMGGLIPASLYPPSFIADRARYLETTARILRAAGARAVLTTGTLRAELETLAGDCPDLRVILSAEAAGTGDASTGSDLVAAQAEPGFDDTAFVQFTSGSTREPCGVVISHGALAANIQAIHGPAGLASSDTDSAVSWLPLYHDMGLVGMALGAMYRGRPAVLMPPETFVKRPVEWLRAISRHRASVSFAPTFAYDLCLRRIRDRDLDGLDLSCWRVAGCGGEPIHAGTLTAFAQRFAAVGFPPTAFLPSYGLAEHVLASTFAPRGRPLRVERLSADDVAARATARPDGANGGRVVTVVSCGFALPGHEVRVVRADGAESAPREIGEIVLAGPSLASGYHRRPDLTAETFRAGWLHTGDLGYLADGELFVCGRIKDVVIVNGRNYHPQDLEWAVGDLPGIKQGRVVAFAAADATGVDRVVIVAEPTGTAAPDVLVREIRRRISESCGVQVSDVVLAATGTVGRTTSGKVQRSATKARYEGGEIGDAPGRRGESC